MARPTRTTTAVLLLDPDGRAELVDGETGTGSWTATAPDRFTFRVVEPLRNPAGGWVHIEQHAVLAGGMFTSRGVTVVCDATGIPSYRAPVAVTGTRLDSGGVEPDGMETRGGVDGRPGQPRTR